MMYVDPVKLLNQRCDFIAKCGHRNKLNIYIYIRVPAHCPGG